MGLFGQNIKKLKILKLSRDSRYLQKLALKIDKVDNFTSDFLKTNEDTATSSRGILQTFVW